MRKKWRKILLFSAYCIGAAALLPNALAAQTNDYPDVENHWAESAVSRWTESGVIEGFDTGLFMPDEPITRGQMATIIDRVMRYQRIAENKFSDLDNNYYTDAILKNNAAGVIRGYGDNTLRPKNNITQQEAICMIARALYVPDSDTAVTGYEIADDWAKPTVYGMAKEKMLDGFTFIPQQPITRAEIVTIIDNVLANLFHTADTYEINTQKSVVVNTEGVSLKDGTIEGNLIISEGVGDGDITLTNMKVLGSIFVQGGGEHSIHLNSCTIGNVVIQKETGAVRVVVGDGTKADAISVNSKASIEVQNAEVNQVVVNQKDSTIDAQKGAKLQKLVLNQSAEVKTVNTIQNVTIQEAASNTKITGTGSLANVVCDAKNVIIDTKCAAITGKEKSSAKTSSGKTVTSGSSGSSSSGGSSSGGSGSGGSSGGGSSSGGSSSGNNTGGDNTPSKKLEITAVNVVQDGFLQVVLNQPSETAFTIDDFSIICNDGGSDMTIISVATNDKQTYDLKTSYFKDQEYEVAITLPDKTLITKVFEYRTDCALITAMDIERTGDTTAAVRFTSDSSGTFYYLLDAQEPISRAAASDETTEEETIIKNGVSVKMNKGSNNFNIEGLDKDKTYSIRYVTVNAEGKRSLVQTKSVPPVADENTPLAIESAQQFIDDDGSPTGWYGFEIRFNRVIEEELTLDNFSIRCPKGATKLSKITTEDHKTYKVYMRQYSVPNNNVTYDITVTFHDGSSTKGDCLMGVNSPSGEVVIVSFREFTRKDENTIIATINSDGNSTLHYLVQNESDIEGFDTVAPKDPAPIYEKGESVLIQEGLNYIPFTGAEVGQYFCFAVGTNAYYEYKKIPEDLPDADGSTDANGVKIVKSTFLQGEGSYPPELRLTFDQEIGDKYGYGQAKIIELPNVSIGEMEISNADDICTGMLFQFNNIETVPAGNYTLQFKMNGATINYPFTVE